nr:hypothetical protein [Tanacetum cinerariifolium]
MEDIDEPDEYFNPGGEIFVSTNNEDVDYVPFMFVILIFLPYLILPEISPLFLFAESEDTIFDPGLSPEIEDFLCWNFCKDCAKFHKNQPKSRTNSTQESKPDQEARFFKNKYTMKLNLSKFQSLRIISAQRSKPNPLNANSKSPRTYCVNFPKFVKRTEVA